MPFDPEAVTSAGSGLVFLNYYDSSVGSDYRNAIINAEHDLQAHFTNPVTVVASFDLAPLSAQIGGSLTLSLVGLNYALLSTALRGNATTPDDFLAVNGLPAADP